MSKPTRTHMPAEVLKLQTDVLRSLTNFLDQPFPLDRTEFTIMPYCGMITPEHVEEIKENLAVQIQNNGRYRSEFHSVTVTLVKAHREKGVTMNYLNVRLVLKRALIANV